VRQAADVQQCRMLQVAEPVAILLKQDVDHLPRVVEPVLLAGRPERLHRWPRDLLFAC
jgi:hypothetical protein